MDKPFIILLNGVGSSGKSSLARALQERANKAFLHVQMDAFLDMLPVPSDHHPDTFAYTDIGVGGVPEIAIGEGLLGRQLLLGMRRAVRGMADAGLNLIIDDVLLGESDPGFEEYRNLLSPFIFRTVGVMASLENLEQRERLRGDRMIGLARWQFPRVHAGLTYDLLVTSDQYSPDQMADYIALEFGL